MQELNLYYGTRQNWDQQRSNDFLDSHLESAHGRGQILLLFFTLTHWKCPHTFGIQFIGWCVFLFRYGEICRCDLLMLFVDDDDMDGLIYQNRFITYTRDIYRWICVVKKRTRIRSLSLTLYSPRLSLSLDMSVYFYFDFFFNFEQIFEDTKEREK